MWRRRHTARVLGSEADAYKGMFSPRHASHPALATSIPNVRHIALRCIYFVSRRVVRNFPENHNYWVSLRLVCHGLGPTSTSKLRYRTVSMSADGQSTRNNVLCSSAMRVISTFVLKWGVLNIVSKWNVRYLWEVGHGRSFPHGDRLPARLLQLLDRDALSQAIQCQYALHCAHASGIFFCGKHMNSVS